MRKIRPDQEYFVRNNIYVLYNRQHYYPDRINESDGSESNGKNFKTNMIAYLFLNTCFLAYFDEYCPLNLINFALCEKCGKVYTLY